MRRTGLILLACVTIYAVAWLTLAEVARGKIDDWLQSQAGGPLKIRYGAMERTGFPFRVGWSLADVTLEGILVMGSVAVSAPSLVLGLAFPTPTVLRFDLHEVRATMTGTVAMVLDAGQIDGTISDEGDGPAAVHFRLSRLVIDGTGTIAEVAGLIQAGDRSSVRHVLALALKDVAVTHREWFLPRGPGQAELRANLSGTVGDGSREAVVAWRDAGGVVDIETLALRWPEASVEFDAVLGLDEALHPVGTGTVEISGFRALVDRQVETGRIQSRHAPVTRMALALMAKPSDDGIPVVRVPLTIQDGVVSAGPFKLGQTRSIAR